MNKRAVVLIFIFFQTSFLQASAVSEWYGNLNSAISGIPTNAQLLEEFTTSFLARNAVREAFADRIKGRCQIKNFTTEEPRGPISQSEVLANNQKHILFWGDSMTDWVDRIPTKFSFPGVGPSQFDIPVDPKMYYGNNWDLIDKRALGGSSSEDLRYQFDLKGGSDPSKFYPNPMPGYNTHINLENRRAVILYGGNDILRYEVILKAVPWLSIFRQNAVINNLNRLVTYHQAQGAQVLIVSHTPRPALPQFNFFGDLGVLGNFYNQMFQFALNALATAITTAGPVYNDVRECIAAGNCTATQTTKELAAASIYSGSKEREVENFLAKALNYSGSKRTDTSWLSQQLGYLTLYTKNLVVMQRNIEYLDEWFAFSDPGALAAGRWWEGNPNLYGGDSIHFSHPFGHTLHASNVSNKISELGWWTNPTPQQGDRCNFTNTATFPTSQPAGWTPEPQPLPEANEDAMLLIILCFYFGICTF
ncbi:hypothetical protein [Leptospira sanjuanensis]|uniref:hypothetical protein n=1 Tax=Leptospira sanjuanensis TaxID=2879643 RepID=UPI001EE7DB12|nr:hypothetical protein [Leptospira sanjuanensis]MCG6168212.1 hypothetical protein [Leptospira sanjuanensis]